MWDPPPRFGLNQQVSGVSDPLPTPQGAVLEYILKDPVVQARDLYQVPKRGRLNQQAWSGEESSSNASDGYDAQYDYLYRSDGYASDPFDSDDRSI